MRKDIFTHAIFLFSFLFLISLLKHWFNFIYFPFWLGGIFGALLPFTDHLFYVYILRPNDIISQDVRNLVRQKLFRRALSLIYSTRRERSKLIFHTAYFQVLFLVLTFFVVTSSGSFFGRGLVLAFSLHLFVDQLTDYMEKKDISSWFKDLNLQMDNHSINVYLIANVFVLFFLGFFL